MIDLFCNMPSLERLCKIRLLQMQVPIKFNIHKYLIVRVKTSILFYHYLDTKTDNQLCLPYTRCI